MIIHRNRESASAEAGELPRGYTLAGYRIERLLGSGGMGTVYEATQLSLKRRVALKVIAAGIPIDETLRERFRREGPLQAVIDHPHILPVYEAGESRGRLFIAMRLVPGQTLKALAAARALDLSISVHILSDIALALDATHAAGLVHRDVKPQNVLVAPGGYAYLADFGLSKGPDEVTVTRAGQLLGSVSYISPEQVRGERAAAASDIYSFACCVFECLVGLVPFPRESDHAVLHAHVWEPPPRPSEIRPELPSALDEVLARGMAKDPDLRPASCRALVQDVRSALGIELQPAEPETPVTIQVDSDRDESESTHPAARALAADAPPRSLRVPATRLAAVIGATAVLIGATGGYLLARTPGRAPKTRADTGRAAPPASPAVAPDPQYAKRLRTTFAALNTTRSRLDARLGKAATPRGQATALAALATEYRAARVRVIHARPSASARSANTSIAVALERIEQDYRHLESAAHRRNRHRYATARTALANHEKELGDALARLKRLGYRLA